MKTQRQAKMEPNSDKSRAAKKVRGSAAKSAAGANGKNPLETYEHAPIGLVECSPDGKHLKANEEFCRLVGYENEELVGKGIKAITHEDDYPIDIKLHQQLVEGRIPFYRLETRYIRKDGRIMWVELTRSVVRDAARNPLYTIGVVLDISDRKHVERVLRDSSERLRLATEAARMFTWELDVKTRIYTVADNFEQVLGFSAGLLSKNSVDTIYRLTPAEDIQAVLEISAKAIKNHSDLDSLQFRVINPENGQVVWLEVNAKIVYNDEDGKPGRIFGVAQNITERKRAEEALRQSEERFVQFMEHLPGLAWIKDKQGRYVYANAAAEKAFNARREELYGKTDQEIFPAETAAQFIKNDEQALTNGMGVQLIETLEQDDGVLHYSLVNKFPIPGSDGNTALIGGTAFDITERKQTEEALRESDERFRAILRQATAGIVRKDAEGRLIFVNQAYCNMLGYTESELLGKPFWKFMHAEEIEGNKRLYNRLMMEGVPFKLEKRLIRQDGSILWADVSVSPIMDATGRPQSAVAVEVDITARKQAEEALQFLNLQLESRVVERTAELQHANNELLESRRRLQILSQRLVEVQEEERRAIARELHDRVGQTLSALNINLIIVRDQLTPDSLERIGPRLDDSMHLVGETITLVRDVMSNLRPAVLDDYGLEAALQSHVDEYRSRYGIKVNLEKPTQPIPRMGPSIEMTFLRIAQEALMNIVRHANASQVILSLWQEGDSVHMKIQDNGRGIVSWQEANRPGSHGLTIMRERAEAFGGDLMVASAPGKGTKVELSIPIGMGNQHEVQQEMLE